MSAKINKISNIQKKISSNLSIKKNKLYKKFIFLNFSDALSFIVQVGIESEKINHHPTISNTYNKVEIWLDTHSVNGLTRLDIKLAERIDNL